MTSTGEPSSTSEDATTEEPTSSTGHPSDTSMLPDFGDDGPDCNGKIDILFALDRNVVMEEYWPTMFAALEEVRPMMVEWFANFDTHWLVATPHITWGLAGCEQQCADTNGETCGPYGPWLYPCAPYTDGSLTECDHVVGAGMTFPAGHGASNKRCELAGGERYIQSSLEPDLLSTLECITTNGWTDIDTVATPISMLRALQPTATRVPGGCNFKFLRDDALLFVIFFTGHTGTQGNTAAGSAEDWAAGIYQAKGFDQDKVAVLGIVTDKTSEEPTYCEKVGSVLHVTDAERFLHDEIKHAVAGSFCADDYVPYFEEAMELALALCGAEPPT